MSEDHPADVAAGRPGIGRSADADSPVGRVGYVGYGEILRALGSDEPAVRRSAAAAALDRLGGPLSQVHSEVRLAVALREFPDRLNAKLAVPHPWVKGALATNRHAPEWLLRRLAAYPDGAAIHELARNPNTPLDILAVLADDPDVLTRSWVAANPSTPPEVLSAMVDAAEGRASQALAGRAELPTETPDTCRLVPARRRLALPGVRLTGRGGRRRASRAGIPAGPAHTPFCLHPTVPENTNRKRLRQTQAESQGRPTLGRRARGRVGGWAGPGGRAATPEPLLGPSPPPAQPLRPQWSPSLLPNHSG